jgi:hypothetical protein
MKYLPLIVATILLCAFQQDPSPERGKADQKSATNAKSDTNKNKSVSSKPASTQTAADSTNEHSSGNDRNENQNVFVTAPEKPVDLIERTISVVGIICTVALAIAGIVGICVALKSLRVIRFQAHEMKRQRITMTRQLETVDRQLGEMSKQTEFLEQSVKIVISKERARIGITVSPLTLREPNNVQSVSFHLHFSGTTAAYILDTYAVAYVSDSAESASFSFSPNIYNIPRRITPETEQIDRITWLLPSMILPQTEIDEIWDGIKYAHFWGAIKYRDAFYDVYPIERETTFRMVWKFWQNDPLGKSIPRANRQGSWNIYGAKEENHET